VKTTQNHIHLFKEASLGFLKNKGFMQAGNMAFLGMLSFFPFLIFLVAVSGFAGQTQFGQEAIVFILSNLPDEVSGAIHAPIQDITQKTGGEVLTFSILFALWSAATGVEAARAVILMAYGEEFRRPMWQQRSLQ
jgi:membrane protein